MCLQKSTRIILLLTVLGVLSGCGALDAILPSTGTYKINALINDTPLDDFSIVTSKDTVLPFFEEPVSDDPDITELVVFLKDSRGQTAGYTISYSLINKENNKEDGKELQQGQDSKTENKDEKKKDETVTTVTDKTKETAKEDTAAEKKNDVAAGTGTDTNKTKETVKESAAEKKDTSGTSANTSANTVTSTDKIKETAKESTAEKKDTSGTSASTGTKTSTITSTSGTTSTNTTTTSTNTSTSTNGITSTNTSTSANTNTSTSTDKSKETASTSANTSANTNTDKAKETAAAEKKKDDAATSADKTNKDKKETAPASKNPLEMFEYTKKGNEINFPVKSLDKTLPFLPIPADLPIGKYTLVFQVKGKNTILYKFEKPLFYLADAEFSFEGIQLHLPGIAESLQFIQNKNVILLDINLDFDSRLEPYVVWYNGKRIIDEGRYSEGAGTLFWKAPEQNGFVSIRAEVFPSWEKTGLTGYQKGISLLVSSKEVDMHLLSKDTTNLVQWYVFEDDLNDSLTKDSEELVIEPAGKNKPKWLPSNGTYGLVSGTDNAFKLPPVPLANDENKNWQIVSRFKLLSEGEIFSLQFGSADVTAALSNKNSNLILSLTSASQTYSESLKLPNEDDSFISVSVKFIILDGRLSAKLTYVKPKEDFNNQKEPVINPISVDAELENNFIIMLGQQQKKPADDTQTADVDVQGQSITTLWDELAILRLPSVEIINIKKNTKETHVEETAAVETEKPEITAANIPNDESTLPE